MATTEELAIAVEYVVNVVAKQLDAEGIEKLKRKFMQEFANKDTRRLTTEATAEQDILADASCLAFNEMCRIQDKE